LGEERPLSVTPAHRRGDGTASGAAGCEPSLTARGQVMGRNVTLGIGTLIIILIVVALVF
jgi:hypothetical protein